MLRLEAIEEYGMLIGPKNDMKTAEALAIIRGSRTKMEVARTSYTYGYMKGIKAGRRMMPVLNVKQISDGEWNEMARRQPEYMEHLKKLN